MILFSNISSYNQVCVETTFNVLNKIRNLSNSLTAFDRTIKHV